MAAAEYERFIKQVLQDFDDRVITVQKKAEDNAKAHEAYCKELKAQLEEVKHERDLARREAPSDSCPVVALLSAMTCLSVHCVYDLGGTRSYACVMKDGSLKGHTFTLTLDQHLKEYTYDPVGSPLKQLEQVAGDFSIKISFADDMLSRFLINLLHATYT